MDREEENRRLEAAGDAIKWLAAGIGLGLLFGAAMGILLAPKSGRETREQLKDVATELGGKARVVARDLGEKAATTYGSVSDKTRTMASDLGTRARSTAKGIGEKVATGKLAATEAIEAAKDGYRRKVEELSSANKTDGEGDSIEVG